ncbi:MAG: hypothetical protein HC904_00130 [Blastochloris sp.]|nr:hypothetical protein [Blastochloris sp.]
MTGMALLHFVEKQVDLVVWETGLGGRLDATNVVEPECCVITGIGWDHMEYLGDTLEKIATEKAGILKKGVPVLWEEFTDEGVSRVFANRAGELDCEVRVVSRAEKGIQCVRSGDAAALKIESQGREWNLGLLGIYQAGNARLALATAELLGERGWKITEEAKERGLAEASWPGRFQVLSWEPPWVLDGAHNVQGIEGVLASWRAWFWSATGTDRFRMCPRKGAGSHGATSRSLREPGSVGSRSHTP